MEKKPLLISVLGLLGITLFSCGGSALTYEEARSTLQSFLDAYRTGDYVKPTRYSYEGSSGGIDLTLEVSFREAYRYERREKETETGILYAETYDYLTYVNGTYSHYVATNSNTLDFLTMVEEEKNYRCSRIDNPETYRERLENEFENYVLDAPRKVLEEMDGTEECTYDIPGSLYIKGEKWNAKFSYCLLDEFAYNGATGNYYYGVAEMSYPIYDTTWQSK